jgi:hypothetical protein
MHPVSQQQRLPCNVAASRTRQRNRAALSALLTATMPVVLVIVLAVMAGDLPTAARVLREMRRSRGRG